MNNFALSKTFKFIKLCNNFLYQKNIVIFLGNRNVLLSAFLQGEIVESKLIPLEMQDDLNQYTDFFNKFRKFHIFFLVDNSLCETRHLSLPMLQSLIKTNPVEKFISEYLTQDDIVAYNVHDILRTTQKFIQQLQMQKSYFQLYPWKACILQKIDQPYI